MVSESNFLRLLCTKPEAEGQYTGVFAYSSSRSYIFILVAFIGAPQPGCILSGTDPTPNDTNKTNSENAFLFNRHHHLQSL